MCASIRRVGFSASLPIVMTDRAAADMPMLAAERIRAPPRALLFIDKSGRVTVSLPPRSVVTLVGRAG
jgi:hypothetical protein